MALRQHVLDAVRPRHVAGCGMDTWIHLDKAYLHLGSIADTHTSKRQCCKYAIHMALPLPLR
eukprot:7122591-Prymnesium_polylepis.1